MSRAEHIVTTLGMVPHPEGGHYVETWRGPAGNDGRAEGTSIYFLLRAGERSHWHRVDATEIWHFHDGDPLRLSIVVDDGVVEHLLSGEVTAGHRPQVVVPADAWQSAETTGEYTLVGCTVTPGFSFQGFELAPAGWSPT
jgi:uncharacterized protein